jgi:hypothetical protein
MGFKAFKEYFCIENHIVSVYQGVIRIGLGHVSNLVGIDMQTGGILANDDFSVFLAQNYPEILNSTNEERLALIQVKDQFRQSIPVYTSCNGQIIEKQCEELGYPNVTHDGEIMYQNSHYANKADAVEYARKDLHYLIENYKESVADLETKLAEKKGKLAESKKIMEEFNNTHPLKILL